jgi:hypothetical protein
MQAQRHAFTALAASKASGSVSAWRCLAALSSLVTSYGRTQDTVSRSQVARAMYATDTPTRSQCNVAGASMGALSDAGVVELPGGRVNGRSPLVRFPPEARDARASAEGEEARDERASAEGEEARDPTSRSTHSDDQKHAPDVHTQKSPRNTHAKNPKTQFTSGSGKIAEFKAEAGGRTPLPDALKRRGREAGVA